MRIALYARVSTDRQTLAQTIDQQLDRALLQRLGSAWSDVVLGALNRKLGDYAAKPNA